MLDLSHCASFVNDARHFCSSSELRVETNHRGPLGVGVAFSWDGLRIPNTTRVYTSLRARVQVPVETPLCCWSQSWHRVEALARRASDRTAQSAER